MSAKDKHYDLELQDFLDGRLPQDVKEKLQSHVGQCEDCRAELEALRTVRKILSTDIKSIPAPENVRDNILQGIRLESPESTRVYPTKGSGSGIFAFTAIVALLIIGIFVYRDVKSSSLPHIVAEDYRQYRSKDLSLQITSTKPEEIESFFRSEGIPFKTRVFDLAMMKYSLRGGSIHRLQNKSSALFVYEGPGNATLVCQMYSGSIRDLPRPAENRENNGIQFFIYEDDGITIVFWQEGDVMCVLASEAPHEETIQLAFAKALGA